MHCPECQHEKNSVSFTSKEDGYCYRMRRCESCGALWVTEQKFDGTCIICKGADWSIDNVRHDGPDRKIRKHTCNECRNVEYTIEKRVSKSFKRKQTA